jgi:hypothetical protein
MNVDLQIQIALIYYICGYPFVKVCSSGEGFLVSKVFLLRLIEKRGTLLAQAATGAAPTSLRASIALKGWPNA